MDYIENEDERITTNLKSLVSFKMRANGFSFLKNQAITSKLSGRHSSKFRGRGINFEEIKSYNLGDDVKSIDWKITLKTGQPHIRSYSEEKDHNIIICVDQSESMYFSSVDTMKSVVAAEIAAICAWKTLSDNDRVGSLIMSTESDKWFAPKRNEKDLIAMLKFMSDQNNKLKDNKTQYRQKDDFKIERTVDELLKRNIRNSIILFISDFYNMNEECIKKLKILQSKNDVLCIHISDPMEKSWNDNNDLILSDGILQLNVEDDKKKVSLAFSKNFSNTQVSLKNILKIKGLPLIELDTSGNHVKDFILQFSGRK